MSAKKKASKKAAVRPVKKAAPKAARPAAKSAAKSRKPEPDDFSEFQDLIEQKGTKKKHDEDGDGDDVMEFSIEEDEFKTEDDFSTADDYEDDDY